MGNENNFKGRVMFKFGLVIVSFVLLSACATTQQVNNDFSKKWLGKNFDGFVVKYGAPYRSFQLQNGDTAYTWNSGIISVDMPATATTNTYGNAYGN